MNKELFLWLIMVETLYVYVYEIVVLNWSNNCVWVINKVKNVSLGNFIRKIKE